MEPKSQIFASHIECSKGGDHEGQLLSFICLGSDCNLCLCCSICLHQSHSGHQTEPVKIVIRQARKKAEAAQKAGGSDAKSISDAIADLRKTLLQTLEQVRGKMLALVSGCEENVEKTCAQLRDKLVFPQANLDLLNEQLQGLKTEADLQSLVTSLKRQETMRKSLPRLPLEITELLRHKSISAKTVAMELSKSMDVLVNKWSDSVFQFNQLQKFQTPQFIFTNDHKHSDIRLISPTEVEHIGTNNNFKMAAMSPPLHVESCISARFKLSDINVGVGVCILERAYHNDFTMKKYSSPGHGFFGMYGSKLVFCHSDPELNYKQIAFSFDPQIPIDVKVAPRSISFSQPQKKELFVLPLECHPKDLLCFCVIMIVKGSKAQRLSS